MEKYRIGKMKNNERLESRTRACKYFVVTASTERQQIAAVSYYK